MSHSDEDQDANRGLWGEYVYPPPQPDNDYSQDPNFDTYVENLGLVASNIPNSAIHQVEDVEQEQVQYEDNAVEAATAQEVSANPRHRRTSTRKRQFHSPDNSTQEGEGSRPSKKAHNIGLLHTENTSTIRRGNIRNISRNDNIDDHHDLIDFEDSIDSNIIGDQSGSTRGCTSESPTGLAFNAEQSNNPQQQGQGQQNVGAPILSHTVPQGNNVVMPTAGDLYIGHHPPKGDTDLTDWTPEQILQDSFNDYTGLVACFIRRFLEPEYIVRQFFRHRNANLDDPNLMFEKTRIGNLVTKKNTNARKARNLAPWKRGASYKTDGPEFFGLEFDGRFYQYPTRQSPWAITEDFLRGSNAKISRRARRQPPTTATSQHGVLNLGTYTSGATFDPWGQQPTLVRDSQMHPPSYITPMLSQTRGQEDISRPQYNVSPATFQQQMNQITGRPIYPAYIPQIHAPGGWTQQPTTLNAFGSTIDDGHVQGGHIQIQPATSIDRQVEMYHPQASMTSPPQGNSGCRLQNVGGPSHMLPAVRVLRNIQGGLNVGASSPSISRTQPRVFQNAANVQAGLVTQESRPQQPVSRHAFGLIPQTSNILRRTIQADLTFSQPETDTGALRQQLRENDEKKDGLAENHDVTYATQEASNVAKTTTVPNIASSQTQEAASSALPAEDSNGLNHLVHMIQAFSQLGLQRRDLARAISNGGWSASDAQENPEDNAYVQALLDRGRKLVAHPDWPQIMRDGRGRTLVYCRNVQNLVGRMYEDPMNPIFGDMLLHEAGYEATNTGAPLGTASEEAPEQTHDVQHNADQGQ